MNYLKLHKSLIDSIDFNECNLRKLRVIRKVKHKAFNGPVNLAGMVNAHNSLN